jgi:transcriptional regulator with XRE-family HTH domain
MATVGSEQRSLRVLRRTDALRELGDAMRRLKDASGKSYESLGRRSLVSASTLHRYCHGEIAAPSFTAVELFARACGATPAQISELHDLWAAVDRMRRDIDDEPRPGAPAPARIHAAGTARKCRTMRRIGWPVAAVLLTTLAGSQARPGMSSAEQIVTRSAAQVGVDLFVLGAGGEVNSRRCATDAVSCTPPNRLDGPARSAPTAVRCLGHSYVFAVGVDGHLRVWLDGTSGQDLGGDLRDGVAASCYARQVQVFAQDAMGRLRQWWYDEPNAIWHRDVDFGPVGSAPAVTEFNGQLQVFARGTDGHLRQWWYDNAYGLWHYGEDLGGRLTSVPAAIQDGSRLHVFGRGADGDLRQWWYDSTTGVWHHDLDLRMPIRSAPVAVAYNGDILVLAAGASGRLSAARFSGAWQTGIDLGGAVDERPAAIRVRNSAQVFAAQRDGTLARWTYDGVREIWQGPAVAGGDAWSAPVGL